uniref:Uncharacterized protein n=1 Tax=Magallana gigas TaxID=29159 RepID=A0A8W8KG21_MAGGI
MSSDMSAGDFRGEFKWAGKEHPHFRSVPSSSLPSEASGRFLSRAFSLEKTRPNSAEKYFKNEFDIKWQ